MFNHILTISFSKPVQIVLLYIIDINNRATTDSTTCG